MARLTTIALIAKQLNDQVGAATQLSAQQLADQNVGTLRRSISRYQWTYYLPRPSAGGALKNLGWSQQQFNEFLAIAGTTASGGSCDAGTSVKAFINVIQQEASQES